MSQKSLFERIGGNAAVAATVNKMYDKILADPDLRPFFAGLDVPHLRRSQTAFMVMAFGGPHSYSGKDLTSAHAALVRDKNLSDKHFDAVAKHLQASLAELNVPADLIGEVLGIVSTTRDAVLGRKKAG